MGWVVQSAFPHWIEGNYMKEVTVGSFYGMDLVLKVTPDLSPSEVSKMPYKFEAYLKSLKHDYFGLRKDVISNI